MKRTVRIWHLTKRFVGSITATALVPDEQRAVAAVLLGAEYELFRRLSVADQRHALHVLRRFDDFAPGAPTFARRAALLHDIGKVESTLGTAARVIATIVGPRTEGFRRYHAHERRGAELLRLADSDARTVELLADGAADDEITGWRTALRRADTI